MGIPEADKGGASTYSLDRDSYEPAYIQLVNIIRAQIAQGIYRAGDQLPPESAICKQFNVSHMTARRAMDMLAQQGIVNTEKGRGTFVKHLSLGTATFHLQEIQNLLGDPSVSEVQLLGVHVVQTDGATAKKLNLEIGDKAIYIRRLLKVHGKPSLYHRAYIVGDPRSPIVEAEMDFTSLEGLFFGEGSNLFKLADLTIEAMLMDDEESGILGVSAPAAGLSIDHIFYDYDGKPVSWGWFICRSDLINFKTRVGIE
jgi:GntR family transcriptional regulator